MLGKSLQFIAARVTQTCCYSFNRQIVHRWPASCKILTASGFSSPPSRRQLSSDAFHNHEEPASGKPSVHKQFSTSLAIQAEDYEVSSEVSEKINASLSDLSVGRLFAVIYLSGKQRKVTTEDIVLFPKHIESDIGEKIRFNKVLLVGGRDFTVLGRPILSPTLALVEGTVIEKTLSNTRVFFKYRKRKDSRKMRLRKENFTVIRINTIELGSIDGGAGS